jgi:hypothetical protein
VLSSKAKKYKNCKTTELNCMESVPAIFMVFTSVADNMITHTTTPTCSISITGHDKERKEEYQ